MSVSEWARVHWTEGLLLSPQHFQQQDRFHETRVAALAQTLGPSVFGVSALEVDRGQLERGSFALSSCDAVMPDGVFLKLEGEQGTLPPARSVAPHFPAHQATLGAFLAVRRQEAGRSSASADEPCDTRYRVRSDDMRDAVCVDRSLPVETALPNAQILFESEERGPYCTVQIAELRRGADGGLSLSEDFIPPIVRVGGSSWLHDTLTRIHSSLLSRGRHLRERCGQHHVQETVFQASDFTDFLMLQVLQSATPLVGHWARWPEKTAEATYVLLASLAGQLAAFGAIDLAAIPPFTQTDLRATFKPLCAAIQTALDAPRRERCKRMALQARDDGVYFGALADENWGRCDAFFIAVRSTLDEAEVVASLPQLVKVAAWSQINGILAAASPGVPVSVAIRPPAAIPTEAGKVYFRLAQDSAYWGGVSTEGNIAVYLPRPFEPAHTEVELLALPGATKSKSVAPRKAAAAAEPSVPRTRIHLAKGAP